MLLISDDFPNVVLSERYRDRQIKLSEDRLICQGLKVATNLLAAVLFNGAYPAVGSYAVVAAGVVCCCYSCCLVKVMLLFLAAGSSVRVSSSWFNGHRQVLLDSVPAKVNYIRLCTPSPPSQLLRFGFCTHKLADSHNKEAAVPHLCELTVSILLSPQKGLWPFCAFLCRAYRGGQACLRRMHAAVAASTSRWRSLVQRRAPFTFRGILLTFSRRFILTSGKLWRGF